MFKLLKKIFLLTFVVAAALVIYKARSRPTQRVPYPYINNISNLEPPVGTSEADILILGDTMGLSFAPYQEILVERASRGLAAPLKVSNWSWTNEGLHRSLNKLDFLIEKEQLPQVVIYFGGSDELKETPFVESARKEILRNFELYKAPRVATAITLVPLSSRLIYLNHPFKELAEFIPAQPENDPTLYQQRLEIHYNLFEFGLRDFVARVRAAGSTPLLMTYPINLEAPPLKVCNNTQNNDVVNFLEQKRAQIKDKRYKEAYSDLKKVTTELVANADAWYLLGMAARHMGAREEAVDFLTKAQMFDCAPRTSGPVFNSIMRKVARDTGAFLIDFDLMMQALFPKRELFLSERFAQNLYYQALARDMAKILRQAFDIK